MKKVLFVGDINVDVIMGGLESLPIPDKEITCKTFDVTMGSTAVISACAYSCLGGSSSFMGLTGLDDYGEFMIDGLKSFNVDTSLVKRTDKVRTGVTINMIHESTRTQVTYTGAISEFGPEHVTCEAIGDFSHIHFAGPYLQTNFIGEITGLLQLAKEKGVTTSIDPQWDPAKKWAYMEEWLPLLTILFVNNGEALSITGNGDILKAFRELTEKTPCPVMKCGPEGVYIMENGKPVLIPTKKITVVDTTGAGDSFDAGFLYAILEKNMPLTDAAKFANAVGTRSCTFVGGVNARSTYDDILKYMEEK